MVSIIMPVYNAEKYISESIDSILAQTFDDWELIIVNDGSRDRSGEICDHYAALDARIKVMHQKNTGVSNARNAGLNKASGELVVFVDADDILPPKSLAIRADLMSDADLAVAGYELFNASGVTEKMLKCSKHTWDQHEAVRNIIAAGELGYQGYIWNKLFRRDIIERNHLLFHEGISLNEDRLFCVEYAMHSKSIRLSDELVYRYRISRGNTMSGVVNMGDKDMNKFMSEFIAFDLALEMVKEMYPDCYYWGALEAQYRAVVLKRGVSRSNHLIDRINDMIKYYGKIALGAPTEIIRAQRKLIVLSHMLLKR